MFARGDQLEDIHVAFATVEAHARTSGKLNLSNTNVHSEDFVKDLLNAVFGWNLTNTNTSTSNYPCIDLIDAGRRVGVQVTSDSGGPKVNKTLKCVKDHEGSLPIDALKVFTLTPKQRRYSIRQQTMFTFDWRKDVLDFDTIMKQARALNDRDLSDLHRAVTAAIPGLFASRQQRLREQIAQIRESRTVFDRLVMRAPFHHEDPVLMCHAIREMRISLQKQGASRIANNTAAGMFKVAQDVLESCEGTVKERFPSIHEAALSYQGVGGPPRVEYATGE
jgi:hypothetical protein